MTSWTPLAAILLATGSLSVAGCAGFATVAGDVAGTAVDKTYQLARVGKAESFQPVTMKQAITAARAAADELALALMREQPHPDQLKLVYQDQRKQQIVITLIRRTVRATEIHVDVGLFGAEGMAQLTLRQLLDHLVAATTTKPTDGAAGSAATRAP
jgi:Protein of unknown function (DUF3568)